MNFIIMLSPICIFNFHGSHTFAAVKLFRENVECIPLDFNCWGTLALKQLDNRTDYTLLKHRNLIISRNGSYPIELSLRTVGDLHVTFAFNCNTCSHLATDHRAPYWSQRSSFARDTNPSAWLQLHVAAALVWIWIKNTLMDKWCRRRRACRSVSIARTNLHSLHRRFVLFLFGGWN